MCTLQMGSRRHRNEPSVISALSTSPAGTPTAAGISPYSHAHTPDQTANEQAAPPNESSDSARSSRIGPSARR